jgi:hypothetical protein
MIKTIQPDELVSSTRSTPIQKSNDFDQQGLSKENNSVDVKMVAQHREIERLVESRQRLHTIKGQIASLHQSMTTPPIPLQQTYEDKLNDSRNIRPSYRFEDESGDGEEIDDDDDDISSHIQTRIKQSVSLMKNLIFNLILF